MHKKGDRNLCSNYRELSIINLGYKLLANVMFKTLYPYNKNAIENYQVGIVSYKSTLDNISIVRQLSENYKEYGQSAWHLFRDYAETYDSVHCGSVWNVLGYVKVPG